MLWEDAQDYLSKFNTLWLVINLHVALYFLQIFAGLLLNIDSIPVYFKWLEYLSIFKYAYEIAVANELEGLQLEACTSEEIDEGGCLEDGNAFLERLGLEYDNIPYDFLALAIFIIFYLGVTFWNLIRLKRKWEESRQISAKRAN